MVKLSRIAKEVSAANLYAPIFEHLAHKYILHGLGKEKDSYWSFHFNEHHPEATRNGLYDRDYQGKWWLNGPPLREAGALAGAVLLHAPLAPFFPYFFATLCVYALNYWRKHKKCHTDPEWAFEHMQNHVKHHLIDPNAFWGVTSGWVDQLAGTAPEVTPEKWENVKDFYLKRYHIARERLEAEVAERDAEQEEKLRASFGEVGRRLEELVAQAYNSLTG